MYEDYYEQLAYQLGDWTLGIIANYDIAQKYYEKARDQIEKLKFDQELYVTKMVDCLHQLQGYCNMFASETFRELWYYLNHPTELKEDGTKFDTDIMLKMLKERIFNEHHINNATFVECISYGYGWAYEFTYEIYGEKVIFSFPMYDQANSKNYLDLRFKAMYYESDNVINLISSDFKRDKVFDEFNKWLDEKEKAHNE